MTSVCCLRDGAPIGVRSFSVGAASLAAGMERERDAEVWARCAALATVESVAGAPLPQHVLIAGDGDLIGSLVSPLRDALAARQPAAGTTVELLTAERLARLRSDIAIAPEDLIAVAAGCA
jgi:hypothetical protein